MHADVDIGGPNDEGMEALSDLTLTPWSTSHPPTAHSSPDCTPHSSNHLTPTHTHTLPLPVPVPSPSRVAECDVICS